MVIVDSRTRRLITRLALIAVLGAALLLPALITSGVSLN
jgi:hypothetical protein